MVLLSPRNQLFASLCFAGVGLTLFFGNGYRGWIGDSGLPLEWIGVVLFVAAVWFFVDAIHRIPRSDDESVIAPQEWQSWVSIAFCSASLVAIWIHLPAFAPPIPIQLNPEAGQAGRTIGPLFVAWAILSYALRQRWAGTVVSDERDLRIEQQAAGWGRAAATFSIISIALMLGFSPTERLQQFSYPWIAQVLMCTLLLGALVDNLAAALLYRRDRHAMEAVE